MSDFDKHAYQITISSFNVLADAYATGTIPENASLEVKDSVSWTKRSNIIKQVISNTTKSNQICTFQEIDAHHYNSFYKNLFEELNYSSIYCQRPERADGCVICVDKSFEFVHHEHVLMDDLANKELLKDILSPYILDKLEKRNIGIIAILKHIESNIIIKVATVHIYWNPAHPIVKEAQVKYMMERLESVRVEGVDLSQSSIIFTGDFNSFPDSTPILMIKRGISSRTRLSEEEEKERERIENNMKKRAILTTANYISKKNYHGSVRKFACDASLGRLARWMRLLGLNVTLEETTTTKKFKTLFDRGRSEKRIIITTSTNLARRSDCPECYLIKQIRNQKDLENTLVDILKTYNVEVSKNQLLSVCGKCGGPIIRAEPDDPRFDNAGIPRDGRALYLCEECHQPYYFNDKPTSSPAMAMRKAEYLYKLIVARKKQDLAASLGIASEGENEIGEEDSISNFISESSVDEDVRELDIMEMRRLTALFKARDEAYLMRQEDSKHNILRIGTEVDGDGYDNRDNESSSNFTKEIQKDSNKDGIAFISVFEALHGSDPTLTNSNQGFTGTLDYIFLQSKNHFEVLEAKVINSLYGLKIENGLETEKEKEKQEHSSYPNNDWPSDHFMLQSIISLSSTPQL